VTALQNYDVLSFVVRPQPPQHRYGTSFYREMEMASSSHLAALAAKHKELEYLLAQEHLRPLPDEVMVAQLKKQKLRLKESMVRVQG
jgi:hypothetical protein